MSLLDKLNKFEKKEASETHIPKGAISENKKVLSVENIEKEKKAQISSFVGYNNSKIDTTICPTCNKRHKITQDKDMDRNEIVDWFTKYIIENKHNFTLDWLRGQKLTFESVNEMRKS